MFVSKAAVVGGGTMGGEIAQAIAAADIPVVVKDIDQKFVDAAIEKARAVTEGQLGPAGQEGEADPGAGGRAPRRGDGPGHRHHHLRGVRRRRLRDRGGAGEDGDQAGGLRRARRGHPRPRDPRLQHLLALDHRDGRDDAARRQGGRLPLLLPGLGDAAGRGDRRRGHLAGDGHRRLQLRPGDQEAADRLRRGAGLRRQPGADGDDGGDLARPGGAGALAEGDRRGDGGGQSRADGAVLPHRPARPRHRPARRRAPAASPTARASTSTRG